MIFGLILIASTIGVLWWEQKVNGGSNGCMGWFMRAILAAMFGALVAVMATAVVLLITGGEVNLLKE